jgi:Arc/MetJ-type ribon-helix-helix transcriptional regulator
MKDTTVCIGVRVPKDFLPIIEKTLDKRGYVNLSDYLRDLIRKDITSLTAKDGKQ